MSKARAKQPIRARGNTLYFSFSHKGKDIRSTTGYKVGQEDLAYAAYLQKRKELENEDNGIQTHRTIQDGLILWMQRKQPTLSQPEMYNTHINTIREFIDTSKPLDQIYHVANEMISDMQEALKFDKETKEFKLRFKNSTINKKAAILSGIATLTHSNTYRWLAEPSSKKIVRLSEKDSERDIYIEPHEVEELASTCKLNLTSELIIFTAYTGLRSAELWRLNEKSLHDSDLHIDGKGKKLRVIPLNDEQVEFIKNNIPLRYSERHIKEDFLYARKECKLMHYTFHDLRHTFGTLMAKAGVPQYKIMRLMGHSTDAMVRRYMKLNTGDLRSSMPERVKPEEKKPELHVVC
jgi:integrase